jgi:hypothetical protein
MFSTPEIDDKNLNNSLFEILKMIKTKRPQRHFPVPQEFAAFMADFILISC